METKSLILQNNTQIKQITYREKNKDLHKYELCCMGNLDNKVKYIKNYSDNSQIISGNNMHCIKIKFKSDKIEGSQPTSINSL